MQLRGVKILKFGGTSMGSAEAMRRVISIVKKSRAASAQSSGVPRAVVVSAMSGVTDELIKIAHAAAAQDGSHRPLLKNLQKRHIETVEKLVSRKHRSKALENVHTLFGYLDQVVTGISLVRELSLGALDYVMSYGERLSAHILADAFMDRDVRCEYLNARNVIVTD